MKNATSLKALVKNMAMEKGISAQLVLQNYMLERLLERIAVSKYQKNLIIKGGFLISSIVGLDSRATMDMDATIKGFLVNQDTVKSMIEEIIDIDIHDDISFTYKQINEIREGDEYTGYRVSLLANYPPMSVPLKLDFTTGDKITPKEIQYDYKLMTEDRRISVLAYNLQTILAEKLETVLSRGDQNTRPRDYYDIYILLKIQGANIKLNMLSDALKATSEKRGSWKIIQNYNDILEIVVNSDAMNRQWENYRKDFSYASEIEFIEVCETVRNIMRQITLVWHSYEERIQAAKSLFGSIPNDMTLEEAKEERLNKI